jgi:hypothetical protein
MKDTRLYIVSDNVQDLRVDMQLYDKDVGLDIFRSKDQGNQ